MAQGFGRLAKSSVKSLVKVSIGRKAYITPRDKFFLQYVRARLKGRRIDEVTCVCSKAEGPASQALMIMSAIAFARGTGVKYVHTPFAQIGHAERPMAEWARSWEEYFDLGAGEEAAGNGHREAVNFAYAFPELRQLYGVSDADGMFLPMVPEFRGRYRLRHPPRYNQVLTVAVHIRRGDVAPRSAPWMWASTDSIAATLRSVAAAIESTGRDYRVSIFSQGSRHDFADLELPHTTLFLDADPIWSLGEAVEADILVTAKRSCFSYYAGLMSDGIVICEDPVYPAMPDWIVIGRDGRYAEAEFRRRLGELILAQGR